MTLPKISLAERLRHFVHAVGALEQRHRQHDLRRLTHVFLQLPTDQQIELLVGAAEFDIGLQRDRVIALDERVEEFVDRDRLSTFIALVEIVAFEHARDRVLRRQFDHIGGVHRAEPFRIEPQFGAFAVEYFVYLGCVGFRVCQHVLAREWLARHVLAARIADHAGEIADQKNDLMSQILKLAHLVEQDGVTQMQIRRGRIEAGLDAQRPAELEPRLEVLALDDFLGASSDQVERRIDVGHFVASIQTVVFCRRDTCDASPAQLLLLHGTCS
jgi:hypothetical protein